MNVDRMQLLAALELIFIIIINQKHSETSQISSLWNQAYWICFPFKPKL